MADPPHVRIAIVDDHEIFRDGLRRLLESEPGFEVVAEAVDGADASRVALEFQPDVMLLDVAMPRMGGVEALTTINHDGTRVILLTAAIEPSELLRAFQLGARGVVLKESATRLLIDGIHRVMAEKYVIGAGVADDREQALRTVGTQHPRQYGLTLRELEIVAAIVSVKHHLTSIFNKTGMSSRLELALFAIRQGLVTPE